MAAATIGPVSLTPKIELAVSAPRMKPKMVRTIRKRR